MAKLDEILKHGSRGVFYGRHSTDGQTLEHQRHIVYEFAKLKGIEIIRDYCDRGVSAVELPIKERPALNRLLTDAEKTDDFDFVIVYMKDRLARTPLDHNEIRTRMRNAKKPIVIAVDATLYDHDDLISMVLTDGTTKIEADFIKRRTRDGKRKNILRLSWNGGRAPYGYKYHKDKKFFEPQYEELVCVRKIFDKYLSGYSFEKTAGMMPPGSYRGGQNWTRHHVQGVVTNPFYAGYLTWNKRSGSSNSKFVDRELWVEPIQPLENLEVVITREMFERAWLMYHYKGSQQWCPRYLDTDYLLQGLAYCSNCNKALMTKDQRTRGNNGKINGSKRYMCRNCDNGPNLTKDAAEKEVLKYIREVLRGHSSDYILQCIREALDKDITTLDGDRAKCQEAFGKYTNDLDTVKENIKGLLNQKVDEKVRPIVEALNIYRKELMIKQEEASKRKAEISRQIERIMAIEKRPEYWNPLLNKLLSDLRQIPTVELRYLLVEFVSKVTFAKSGEAKVTLRFIPGRSRPIPPEPTQPGFELY